MRVFIAALLSLPILTAATGDYQKQPDGIVVQTAEGAVKVQVVADNIVRVEFAKSDILFTNRAKAALPHSAAVKWTLTEANGTLTLATARLKARVERQTGRVSFVDAAGQPILAEAAGARLVTFDTGLAATAQFRQVPVTLLEPVGKARPLAATAPRKRRSPKK